MSTSGSATRRARAIVDELIRGGVRDAVLCPGSRNAPIAVALHAADAEARLRLHVRIDERGAGFLAVGLARRSGRPVPVCTTSGTAVANLHPAVLEASYSDDPVIALTADRPTELVGTGASQTVDQRSIFGGAVRLALATADDESRVRAQVCRALAAATGRTGPPGPVHVDVPLREPLMPDAEVPDGAPSGRPDGVPWTAVTPTTWTADALPLDPAAPTVVIAGAGAPDVDFGSLPVVAEPGSAPWARSLRSGPWLLSEPRLRPRQVVVAGRPTLHRGVARLLADPDVAVHALAGPGPWPDVPATVRAVGSLPPMRPDQDWVQRWEHADRAAAAALDEALDDPAAPAGLRLARAMVAALPRGAALTVGSSNPIRDVALAAAPRPDLAVVSNRGVAGIDGTISTAAGVALAHDGPAFALLGDLTFLHDVTALVIGPDEPRPDLTLVVLNDRGGGIFTLLEQGDPRHAGAFERVFGTPHDVDVAGLCAAMGVPHEVRAPADVGDALAGPGLRVVEVPAGRERLRAAHADLRTLIDGALSRVFTDRT